MKAALDAKTAPRRFSPPHAFHRLRVRLRSLYRGDSPAAVRFRYSVICIDLAIIAFFIAGPMLRQQWVFLTLDYAIAAVLGVDLAARALTYPKLSRWLRRPVVWVDIFIWLTLLLPEIFLNLGFLRVARLWTLVHSEFFWRTIGRRYDDTRWEDVAKAGVNLVTFVFVATGFVYASFARIHPGIDGYVDALYFTVAALTTTGFGDITLPGTWGRLISIGVMISGITLFVQLAQTLFRPHKVIWPCPSCGLLRHDPDAVHCKACGQLLAIPNKS